MLLDLAHEIQASELSTWLSGSTWAVPILGALHVLGIAWFAGAALLSALSAPGKPPRVRSAFLWAGGIVMLATGGLLFITEPVRCLGSHSFQAKLLLLVGSAAVTKVSGKLRATGVLALWVAVLLASRGIAYF